MYLKALEIQGFKSFPDKTRLTFEKDITAIVGPNGSGKSNISDAILWVMGEQRTRALRGGKMEDVIFGGTQKRNALGFAQVSLILDNAQGILPVENTEVMITRRYYRSGDSEYFINRRQCRLKDIHELLMDTGLGRDGYSIIGQGKIADIVSAKSSDRREIFEEAAGISRYRHRKEEAERKLDKTEENLLRINDKIDELELQVGPLKKQAETAKRFLVLRDELREIEVSVWMETLDRLKASSESVEQGYAQSKDELSKASEELDRLYASAEEFSDEMQKKDMEAESKRSLLSQTESSAAECESAAAVLRVNMENNAASMERLRRELEEQENRADALSSQIADRRGRIAQIMEQKSAIEDEVEKILESVAANTESTDEAHNRLRELVSREGRINDEITQSKTMMNMLTTQGQELMDRESACASELNAAKEKLESLNNDVKKASDELKAAQERVQELDNMIAGYRMRLNSREGKLQGLQEKNTRLTIDLKSMESRISMLSDMERDFEGFNKAVKTVMQESKRGTLKGIHGPVGSLLKTEDKFTLAVETSLGGGVQSIVVDTQENGKSAIEFLKKRDGGRGTFLPISAIKGRKLDRLPKGEDGYIGTALELVSFDEKYSGIFSNLLGRTVVTETLGHAVAISKKFQNQLRIVTLDGQMINAGGSMTGGSVASRAGILSRANELKRLQADRDKLNSSLEKNKAELSEAERERNASKYELEVSLSEQETARENLSRCDSILSQTELLLFSAGEAEKSLSQEKESLQKSGEENTASITRLKSETAENEESLSALKAQILELTEGREEFDRQRKELNDKLSQLREESASLSAESGAVESAIAQMESMRLDITGDSTNRIADMSSIESHNKTIEEELASAQERLRAFNLRIEEIKAEISNITGYKLELEGRRNQSQKQGQEKNKELLELERICARFEQKKLAAEMEEKQILDKLWETYELSHSAAEAARKPIENLQKSQRRINEIKREISSLGSPNVGAIEEFERVNTRYTFLTEQRDDILKSKKELLEIIHQITHEMEEIFSNEFKAIDECFRETFLELFGGGKASLVLEDESDVLNCGIEIQVQPPGKALSTISLLSGGEKSFIAIAIYFAILKVRPTPFCVMDEIEAALDEVNVIKFAEYMRRICSKTQFIVITHRRGTMEEADILYGVTMQEKGVSSIIAMDIAEAERTIA